MMLGAMAIPGFKDILITLLAVVAGTVVLWVLGYFIFRYSTRTPASAATSTFNLVAPVLPIPKSPSRYMPPSSSTYPSLPATVSPPEPEKLTPAQFIERLRNIDWFQFEKVIALVYKKLGHQVERRGGANPDGGVDLIIKKNGERKAVQCKQWKTWNVGVKPIREFVGAMIDGKFSHGIFITLKGYRGQAKDFAARHNIEILTGNSFVRLLDQNSLISDREILEVLNDPRKFCPKCESQMFKKTNRKGGSQFWGCSTFPQCDFIFPI